MTWIGAGRKRHRLEGSGGARGEPEVDVAGLLHLGVILYELMCGQWPHLLEEPFVDETLELIEALASEGRVRSR